MPSAPARDQRRLPANGGMVPAALAARSGPVPAKCCPCFTDVHPVQAEQVLPENLPYGLVGQLRVAIALAEIFRDLEVHEGPQRPLRMENGCLGAVDDLVFAAPEQQLSDDLGKHPR